MLTESALLTLAGGGAGLLLAFAAMPAISRVLPPIRHLDATSLPLNLLIEPDLRIFGFSLLLCVITTILFGIGPAFQAGRRDFYSSLKAVRSTRRWTGRSAVVMAQVALCTFLLTAAGLLLATFDRLRRMDPGFDSGRVVTFSVDPEMKRYTKEQQQDLEMRLVAHVETLPGVEHVAIAGRGLMRGTGIKITVVLPGQALDQKTGLNASVNWITPSYFSVMGMRLAAGRNYSNHEPVVPPPAPAPAVVNQSFARHFFPDLDPIGRKFGTKADRQIIGVVSDAKYRSLREPVPPTVYSLWNSGDSFLLHVRTRMQPEGIVAAVQDIMRGIDPELPFYEIKTLAEEVDASLWAERLVASLASVFAVLAALLAAIGIYGLLSYTVAQRTGEIGIRMALGAAPRNIVRLLCSQAFGIVLVGIALGIAAALAAAQSIRYLLYDVAPHNIGALSAAALSVIVVASIAAAIPAIRASRVEPAVALRHTMNC